jgi:hypothetical protein
VRFSAPKISLTLLALIVAGARVWADPISEERIEKLFRPLLGERMAMSTDGHYLAYTQHEKTDLLIMVYDLEKLKLKTRIVADEDRPIMFSKEKERTALRFLDWANDHRLVFAPTVEVVRAPMQLPGSVDSPQFTDRYIAPVMAVDADGGNPVDLQKKVFEGLLNQVDSTIDPRTFVPELLGFGTSKQRDQLRVEYRSAGAGKPSTLFGVNVETHKHTRLHEEFGLGPFIYDWSGQPRLRSISDRISATTAIEYHAPDSKRWGPVPTPVDEGAENPFALAPANYFGARSTALGFDFDPNVLLYASNVGHDTFGIYGMDVRTRQRTELALEVPNRDLIGLDTSLATSPLVFDSFQEKLVGMRTAIGPRPLSVWLDEDFARVQRSVENKFPERSVELLQWNEARTRFLLRTSGGTDPGSIFILRRPENSMTELTRAAPWLKEEELHETEFFEFTAPSGAQLTGYLTLPSTPRLNPPPLIIWFAPGIPPQPHRPFDPQAQVLADLGFVVCRLNQRGVLGLGAEHRDALRRNFDHATAEDAVATIEWIAEAHRIDRKRVATLGEGFAGHLAVRATQLYPSTFRCAIVFDPIFHFLSLVQRPPGETGPPTFRQQIDRIYLDASGVKLEDLSVTAHANELNAAVFIATHSGRDPAIEAGVAELRAQLRRRDLACVSVEFNQDFALGLPAARARVYRALDEFINLNLYNYDVKIGPTRVVK